MEIYRNVGGEFCGKDVSASFGDEALILFQFESFRVSLTIPPWFLLKNTALQKIPLLFRDRASILSEFKLYSTLEYETSTIVAVARNCQGDIIQKIPQLQIEMKLQFLSHLNMRQNNTVAREMLFLGVPWKPTQLLPETEL